MLHHNSPSSASSFVRSLLTMHFHTLSIYFSLGFTFLLLPSAFHSTIMFGILSLPFYECPNHLYRASSIASFILCWILIISVNSRFLIFSFLYFAAALLQNFSVANNLFAWYLCNVSFCVPY